MSEVRTIRLAPFLLPFMFNEQRVQIEADMVKRRKIVTKIIFDDILHGMELMEEHKPDLNDFLDFHVDVAKIKKDKKGTFFYIHLLPSEEELKKLNPPEKKEENPNEPKILTLF